MTRPLTVVEAEAVLYHDLARSAAVVADRLHEFAVRGVIGWDRAHLRREAVELVDRLHTSLHAGDHDDDVRSECRGTCCTVCRTADAGMDDDGHGTEAAS